MSELLDLELTAMVYGGRALGRHEGRPIFVPFGVPGERVLARITQDKRSYAFAEMVDVIVPSPERIEPRCPHFGVCGGCQQQQIDYPAQLRYKRDVVVEQLARIGGLRDVVVHPTLASPDPFGYRSHVTFHVTRAGRLGFVAVDDKTVIPIDQCSIIRPELSEWLERLKDRRFKAGERVRLQVGSEGERLMASLRPQRDSAPDDEAAVASGERVHYRVKHQSFQVTGGSFFQVNLPQAERLVDLVLAGVENAERVLDLYSGVGLFTAFLAERARQVTAVEVYAPAVRDAEVNLADLANVDLRLGTIEAALTEADRFDAAVVDPPRAGIKPQALRALIGCEPKRIVYVSCDPSTLARDAKLLVGSGYHLIEVQPVDMFPQTYHVEAAAIFDVR